jgi:hypothetical protein
MAWSNEEMGAPGSPMREKVISIPSFDFVTEISRSSSVNGDFVHIKAFGIPDEPRVGGIASIAA